MNFDLIYKKLKIAIAYILSVLCLITANYLDELSELKEIIELSDNSPRPETGFLFFFGSYFLIFALYLIGICFPLLLTYFLLKKK